MPPPRVGGSSSYVLGGDEYERALAALSGCAFAGCSAEGRGGAVSAAAAVSLAGVEIRHCAASYGGAVWAAAAVRLSEGSIVAGCTAFLGGAVYLQGPAGAPAAARAGGERLGDRASCERKGPSRSTRKTSRAWSPATHRSRAR